MLQIGKTGIQSCISYRSERGIAMWAGVVCPQCGEHVQIDLGQVVDLVFCPFCRESFELTDGERARLEREHQAEAVPMAGYLSDAKSDSSFWLG